MSTIRQIDITPVASADDGVDAVAQGTGRLDSLDSWRGLVIVLMVLDHVRDYFHFGALAYAATDPGQTTWPLYATRWITHLCAPTFIFLAGTSIRLQREKTSSMFNFSCFLMKRGFWLIALELTVVSFGFNMGSPFFFIQVIYAIGISTLIMAALIWLPAWTVSVLGVTMIAGAPILIAPLADATGLLGVVRMLAILPGGIPGGTPGVLLYPFLPWLGVMCLGYGYGQVFRLPRVVRNRAVAITALLLLLSFAIVRGGNVYGDPAPWQAWPDALRTIESFLNVSKYPASPDYVMITLGTSMLLFLALDFIGDMITGPLLTFGRTSLFTYLLHIYVVHGAQLLIGMLLGYPLSAFTGFVQSATVAAIAHRPAELTSWHWGFPLWGTYMVWIAVVILIYPLSHWYEKIKRGGKQRWPRYV